MVGSSLEANGVFGRQGPDAGEKTEQILRAVQDRLRVEPAREVRAVLASAISAAATRRPPEESKSARSVDRFQATNAAIDARDAFTLARALVEEATALVDAPGAPRALRAVAGAALLETLRQEVELSPRARLAVWHWIVEHPGTRFSLSSLENAEDAALRSEALALLGNARGPEHGAVLAGLILGGPGHRHLLEDEALLSLLASERSGPAAWSVRHVVQAAHESRGVQAAALRAFLARQG